MSYQSAYAGSSAPVVVITGASAGVGRATALAFARRGWRVALLARGRERLESAKAEVEWAGGQGLAIVADVAKAEDVFAAAERVGAEWGRIDVWVNNAMATIFAPIDKITPAEFRRVTEVTYLGQVHGTLAALRHMRDRGIGVIIQVGSALSYRSIPLQSAYCAAKFAVRGFTDSLRCELIHQGSPIRLTMVQLPAVNTPQFDWARSRLPRRLQPVPPIFQPETIAEAIYSAAMTTPRELWVGLPTIKAVLATMLLPGWLDRLASGRAWQGQMTAEPANPDREGNLFQPPPGDPGAHGRFGPRSRSRSMAVSGTQAKTLAAAAAALGLFGIAYAAGQISRTRPRLTYSRYSTSGAIPSER